MAKILHAFQLEPENLLKLRLLSVALDKSQGKLINLLIASLWDEKSEIVSSVVNKQKVDTESKRILDKIIAK